MSGLTLYGCDDITEPALEVFNPTQDTEIQGTVRYSSVNIPAGVTVRATSDLVMSVSGAVQIAGALVGDCVGITVAGESAVTVTGSVGNSCSGGGRIGSPALALVGNGDLVIDGATISSSGDIEIKNDPTLAAPDFATSRANVARVGAASVSATGEQARASQPGSCELVGADVANLPERAADGASGPIGEPGENGRSAIFLCRGDAVFNGAEIRAQNGGHGGSGDQVDPVAAAAEGGSGGRGGFVIVDATGDLVFVDALVSVGRGGNGGSAVAIGEERPGGLFGAGALATGGDGGHPGRALLAARGDILFDGALNVFIRGQPTDGGNGGPAFAQGAKGLPATSTDPPQDGGFAEAKGGAGAPVPRGLVDLVAGGTLGGVERLLIGGFGGETAGSGGAATAIAGTGGDGNAQFPDGGAGGRITARGGTGGDVTATHPLGLRPVGDGGAGGKAGFRGGNGGSGFVDCDPAAISAGGDGGRGGSASGGDGAGGMGLSPGENGGVELNGVGNSGDGGDGEPPGIAGQPGFDATEALGTQDETPPIFERGADGDRCRFALGGTYDVIITVLDDPAGHDPFINLGQVSQLTVEVSGSTITVSGPAPWVDVSGTLESDGFFVAIGRGTVAGFSDIDVTMIGFLLSPGVLTAEYRMGDEGGLPEALPIIYGVEGEKS